MFGDFRYLGLENLDTKPWKSSSILSLLFAFLQMTFAIFTAAITSGATVERMGSGAHIVFISQWCMLVYAPLAQWKSERRPLSFIAARIEQRGD